MKVLQIPEVIETYSSYANVPSPSSALLLPGDDQNTFSVHSTWTTRDLKRSELTRFSRSHIGLSKDENLQFISTNVSYENSESLLAFSPSGSRKAVLREALEKAETLQYLEIWDSRKKIRTFPVKNLKVHGKIYDDGQFGCLCWSPNEKFLLYVAEKKQPKYESFFEKTTSNDDGDSQTESSEEKAEKGEESLFREDWGEALVGKHHSVLCVMNVDSGHVRVFSLGENISAGPAIWACSRTIVCVGWNEAPRRLGLMYCINRRSDLYRISIETEKISVLCPSSGNVRSPRYFRSKKFLMFLDKKDGGPHCSGSRLVKLDWKTEEQQVIVDLVENPSEGSFPGLYVENLPLRCYSEDGSYIFLSTPWRSTKKIISINTSTGDVQVLSDDDKFGSYTVLDVKNNVILASASSPNIEPCLLAGVLSFGDDGKISAKWTSLDGAPSTVSGFKWSVISLVPPESNENQKYPGVKYEAILISPESTNESVPLIVWPHGGPHSVFSATFMLFSTLFAKLGFAVCMVNFRGSIGFGENSIKSLPGNIGVQDVQDVQFAVESVMKREDLKINDVVLFGGSHGGFLVAHLSGQYPNFYKVCICRNPVIDISGKIESTDIPDWAWVESGLRDEYDFATNPNPEVLTNMWMKSPIRYIKNVKIPTLILLGKNDLRVPPSQGKKYYHSLHARNVPVRMYMFDDRHALSKVGVEAEGFMQTILWLKQYLSAS